MTRTAVDQAPLGRDPRHLSWPFTRWPRAADAALAVAVFLLTVFGSFGGPDQAFAIRSLGDVPIAAFPMLALACGSLYWRRSRPLLVLGVTLGASAVSLVIDSSDLVGIAMIVALYSAGRYVADDRWSYLGLAGAFILVGVASVAASVSSVEIAFGLVLMFGVWYTGRRVRSQRERAEQLEREHATEARRVVAEERTRIARELHDIVAHRVSLMTVQAGAARTVAADDPEGAVRAMGAVEEAGREALEELRHVLGVLRPAGEAGGLGPQPGLADVPGLVDQFRDAGLTISFTMDGVPANLPARVDLSVYRIVEEALTNVLKHAGLDARTEVRLRVDDHVVAIEVLDDGSRATTLPGSGHGIVGMRERASMLGGRLDARPRPTGGFEVIARLPIGKEPG